MESATTRVLRKLRRKKSRMRMASRPPISAFTLTSLTELLMNFD